MKLNVTREKQPKFNPFKIEIEIKTWDDANSLAFCCNPYAVLNWFKDIAYNKTDCGEEVKSICIALSIHIDKHLDIIKSCNIPLSISKELATQGFGMENCIDRSKDFKK